MNYKIAKFEKISIKQYELDEPNSTSSTYQDIKLPKRGTVGSAGYDFFMPYDLTIKSKETCLIKTGIRCKIDEGFVLSIYPRSSLGFKYQLMLDNTVGIIDSDYYFAKNEGHIMIKVTNHSTKDLVLDKGVGFAQGIFTRFYLTIDDDVNEVRTGGIGSTNKG